MRTRRGMVSSLCLVAVIAAMVGCAGTTTTPTGNADAGGSSGGTSGNGGSAGGGGAGARAAGGSGGSMGGCDAAASYTPDKVCASALDCVIADRGDCCGTVKVGIRKGSEVAFAAANQRELACTPGCGLRGCFHADMDEEMKTGSSFTVTCDNGACRSHAQ